MRINEQGRSMIEMLGVLAIVGVLSVGGIAGYSKAMNKFKANKVIDQINMLSTNIRTMYSSQRSYKGLNNGTAVSLGLAPSEMYDASSNDTGSSRSLMNAFAGNVYIRTGKTQGSDDGAYIITIDGIPSAACITLVTTDWGGESGSGLAGFYVKPQGTTDTASSVNDLSGATLTATSATATGVLVVPGSGDVSMPLTLVQANTVCASANNVIAWKFL